MRFPASACRSDTTSASGRRSRRWSGWSRSQANGRAGADPGVRRDLQEGPAYRTISSSRRRWTAGGRFAATCRSWSVRACRICRRRTCAGTLSRWPPARARPGSSRWPSFGRISTRERCRVRTLSTNFLIVAPNVIVYQRLEKDFASNRIFHELPLVPPEWRRRLSRR